MTSKLEDIPTMTATERYIQIAKREDPDKWERAYALRDAVLERLSEEQRARALLEVGRPVNTGCHKEIAAIWEEVHDQGLVEHSIKTLQIEWQTATAWPEEMRVKGATYGAHRELRGLDRRQQRLSKWVAQTSTGYFGRDDARREKAELSRKKFGEGLVRPPERFDKAIRRNLSRWATGGKLSESEAEEAIGILNSLIVDIESGEY